METVTTWFKQGVLILAIAAMIIACILLFLLLAFAFRLLLMAGLVTGLLGCAVLSYCSPRFHQWFEALGEAEISYHGLRLATDVAVYPGHSWASISPENVAVGADDLLQAVLGPVEAVELPPAGSRVERGGCLFALRRADRRVEVRSPVSGTVTAANQALLQHPELINQRPFTGGWAVRLRADKVREDRHCLLEGKAARGWFRHEIDRLIAAVPSHTAVASALPDGGAVVPDLYRQIDDGTWKRLSATFFGGEGAGQP
jgi:glycine cleavage system H protein